MGTPSHPANHPSVDATSHGEAISDQRPEESQNSLSEKPKELEAGPTKSSENSEIIIVKWDGEDDPMNPRNWSILKKWAAIGVVSSYTFMSPIASSMMAPAARAIAHDFNITNSAVLSMTVSIFVLAYAFGPLLFAPLSELFGRARVIQLANLFFLVFNIACGFAQTTSQFLAFRFLAGFGGSAPLSIGGGVIGDCFSADERGKAVAIYSLAPVLGPVIGPVAGAWLAETVSWRWVFHSTSIACAFVQFLGLIFLRETFAPILLAQKAQKIRVERGIDANDRTLIRTEYDSPDRHWKGLLLNSLIRPFTLFIHELIIQLLGVYMAFMYVPVFASLILVTLPDIFQNVYKQRVGIAGLHYIALGIGLSGASQINARLLDMAYKSFKNKNGGVGKPEFRLPSMAVGVFLLPIGLLMFGWAAEKHVFWIVVDILHSAGMILIFQSIQSYVIDAFTLYAASALAAVTFIRSIAGFAFPLFAPAMYNALGYGKGDTILAVFAIVVGIPV
ncbi:MFS polyamine transporter [Hysterangium stoloniferum]|nr:MFS polyamine transporter [Hysterangium stoloniferum]